MEKLKIGIDLDDTLNNHVNKWLEYYNRDYNDNFTLDMVTGWNIADLIKPECGAKIHDYTYQPNWFYDMDIQPYAYEVTKWLKEYYDLYIITAYNPYACLDKFKWVQKYLPHIDTQNIIFCNDKSLVQVDYLIDDRDKNIIETPAIGLLYDKAWNRHLGLSYYRVRGWLDIQKYFKKIGGKVI